MPFLYVPIPPLAAVFAFVLAAMPAGLSLASDSIYSKIDDANCQWDKLTAEQGEEGQGGCATCPGPDGYIVRLCEGDLRQSTFYGSYVPDEMSWQSFGEFNRAGPTVEWRLVEGVPVATIHRFFIENMNDNGEVDPKREGQVLVISTVATPDYPYSCHVGYVDARANADANVLAQKIADEIAIGFQCENDRPAFYGKRGPFSGTPTGLNE